MDNATIDTIYKVYLGDQITELEWGQLCDTASEFGVSDCTIAESGRIILAETSGSGEEGLKEIIAWTAHNLFQVEDITAIEEQRFYYPCFEDGEDHGEFLFIIDLEQ